MGTATPATAEPTPPPDGEPQQDAGGGSRRGGRGALRLLLSTLVVFLALYGGALWVMQPASPGEELGYNQLLTAAQEGRVQSARFLDEDARVTGTLVTAEGEQVTFNTTYPSSDAATNNLLNSLAESEAQVSVEAQTVKGLVRFVTQFLLPLVILANLFAVFFVIRGAGTSGGGSGGGGVSEFRLFGRMRGKHLAAPNRGETTFTDVAGAEEVVPELADIRDYLANPQAVEAMGAVPPKGVLLKGPPGCGKTLLAKAVAGEANATFYSVSGSEFVESLVGVGASRVRDLFAQARGAAPAILFIDELDGVGRQRGAGLGGGHDEREQTLNELLVQMDGFSAREGVVVIGATNRPDILDPALLRPGRFDRQVTIDRPDVDGRLEILQLHAARMQLANPQADLPAIAAATPGFTGADLASVLNEAALLAVRAGGSQVTYAQLEEAVERVVGGAAQKTKRYSQADKERLAYHEAGHTVVAAAMGKTDALDKVSIIARGKGVGHLRLLAEDTEFPTRVDIEVSIAVSMAGLASEQLVFDHFSIGSEEDLQRATRLAKDLAGRYGMSDRLGRVRLVSRDGEIFLGRDYLATAEVSQPTLEGLDAEVRHILDDQEAVATAVLSENAEILDTLADALINEETVKGRHLGRLLQDVVPHERPDTTAAEPATQASGNGGSKSKSKTR
jgi:cell division protease FtsH